VDLLPGVATVQSNPTSLFSGPVLIYRIKLLKDTNEMVGMLFSYVLHPKIIHNKVETGMSGVMFPGVTHASSVIHIKLKDCKLAFVITELSPFQLLCRLLTSPSPSFDDASRRIRRRSN
jgi:hypothetical protein